MKTKQISKNGMTCAEKICNNNCLHECWLQHHTLESEHIVSLSFHPESYLSDRCMCNETEHEIAEYIRFYCFPEVATNVFDIKPKSLEIHELAKKINLIAIDLKNCREETLVSDLQNLGCDIAALARDLDSIGRLKQ